MKKNIPFILIITIIVGFFAYLLNSQTSSSAPVNKKIQVIASFYPMYYFATQIAGDKADITNITPSGAEPHDYEPTAQEIVRIEQSNLLILNGGNLEAWGNKIKEELTSSTIVVLAGENLVSKQLVEDGQTIQDPHVWLSPPLAKQQVENINEGFIKVDPSNTPYYETKAKLLEDKLDALDTEYAKGLAFCTRTDFVTSHAAFGYLADRYHLNQIAIAGVSPEQEPSTQKLTDITNFVKTKGIKYIFFESLVSPKLSETIANETGAQTMILDPIEGISEDDIRAGKNYFTQMEMNLKNLELALQCKA